MTTPTNHWKLGLFVVVGVVATLVTLVFLGAKSLQKETVAYKTYFDESVQGLDVGSPVKFRGVTVGNVSHIDVAVDHRHVEVVSDITVSELNALGWNATKPKPDPASLANPLPKGPDESSELRMQLASAGITGVKFIQIDFFNSKDNPPPLLPFPPPVNYIPAASSTMKNIEDAVVKAMSRVPEIVEQVLAVTIRTGRLVEEFQNQNLPQRSVAIIAKAEGVLESLQSSIKQANVGQLSGDVHMTLQALSTSVAHLNTLLARVEGEKGLLSSAQRATDSLGDLAGGAKGLGAELEETLRSIREAVGSIQRVAEALDSDSDMLLKGRSKAGKR